MKDKYGFAWIATQDGLNRFDGKEFNMLLFAEDVGRSDIRDLFYDSCRNYLWALGGERCLFQIDVNSCKVLKQYFIPKKSEDDWNMCFSVTGDYIWLGCLSGIKLFKISSEKFVDVPHKASLGVNDEIRSMVLDKNQNLWVFNSVGKVSIIAPLNLQLITEKYFLANDNNKMRTRVWTAVCANNHIMISTDKGIYKFVYNDYKNIAVVRPTRTSENERIYSKPCYAITRYGIGSYLVACEGLYLMDSSLNLIGQIQSKSDYADWLKSSRNIMTSKNGDIWLGCTQGFMFFYPELCPFTAVNSLSNSHKQINHVYSILKRGGILYVNADDYLYQYSDGKLVEIAQGNKLLNLMEGPNNEIWASSANGTLKLVRNGFASLSRFQSISSGKYNSSLCFNQTLMLGTDDYSGVVNLDLRTGRVSRLDLNSTPRLFSNIVKSIYKDRSSGIWILSDNIISYKRVGVDNFKKLSFADKKRNEYWMYFDMCEAAGYYWIAVHHYGIIQVDKELNLVKQYTPKNGLCNSGVYNVFSVGDSALIITTNIGLSVFNISKQKFDNYYESDGLHGNAFEESCGFMDSNLIYAGGVKGFTIIDPSKFRTNTVPPRVYINRIFVDRTYNSKDIDTTNLEIKTIKIPSDVLQTTLYFSGINYSNPERTTFEYRIIENNKNWVNIGTQSYLNLIGLPPGTYHLEIKAANEDGYWSTPISLELIYLPKWYQAWWFKSMLLLCCIGFGYLIYRFRMNQLLKQQQIRRDVAADLHDDIGSTLNSVKVFAHLAKGSPLPNRYIQNVEDNLEQATAGLRDMIWILDDKQDSISDLCNRLYQSIAKPAEAIGIEVHFDIHENLSGQNLPKHVKRNLYLIIKEAINNSIKYAECRHIWITFGLRQKRLVIKIKDDGKGFDATTVADGYGLSNIKMRAEQIHFDCTIKGDTTGVLILIVEK